ncbi:hypothetical protein C8A01DRAFT_44616 [Parachaetomium inaequale]|uniref:Uncharacterized protein n=1 Tax=Parachaetomium inaequale TaxID=2588326 RepID=A0AAN6PJX5_9PEZI|nr:hypothetical protein C8A01DRAFT_44616 [Parachaetomium inaequale]
MAYLPTPPPSVDNVAVGNNQAEQPADEAAPNGYDARMLPATTELSRRQWAYLLLIQALSSMLIAGALNFAAGYPVYATPRPPPGPPPQGSIPPFLFRLPVSLVADAALTTIIQSLITWFCLVVLVNRALSRGAVAPHTPGYYISSLRAEPTNKVVRWFLMLDHYNAARGSALFSFCGSLCTKGFGRWVGFVLGGFGRGMITAVVGYAVMIGPTIGLCAFFGTPYEGDWVFLGRWDGVVFKTVYGGFLGLFLSPALAYMWMVRAGWIVDRHVMV